MSTLKRIVLTGIGGDELFSGSSVLSEPPAEPDEESPETLRSPVSVLPSSRRSEPVIVMDEEPPSRNHAA